MEQLVITAYHPLFFLPFELKRENHSVVDRLKGMRGSSSLKEVLWMDKNTQEEKKQVLFERIKTEFQSWSSGVTRLKNEDKDFYFLSILPSINVITETLYGLGLKLSTQSKNEETIESWQFSIFRELEGEMRNVRPNFYPEDFRPERILKIKEKTKIVEKHINFDDCIQLYVSNPEEFLRNVEKLSPIVAKLNSEAQLISIMNEFGLIEPIREDKRFGGNVKKMADFIRLLRGENYSNDSYRNALNMLDEPKGIKLSDSSLRALDQINLSLGKQ